jgi:citrate lyase subunit beta/citryl-CoA lyase
MALAVLVIRRDIAEGFSDLFGRKAINGRTLDVGEMIVAARAHGIDAIDGPFGNFKDPEGYRREATWAAMLGAVGKWAIHPSQIEPANDVFAPTSLEIEQAREMSEAYRAAEKQGAGAAGAGGVLVDAAAVRIYEGVLERARLCGRIP